MTHAFSEFEQIRQKIRMGGMAPRTAVERALAHANSNAGKNVYLALDPQKALREAEEAPQRFAAGKPLLYGLPVSLKDLFDLKGYHTTCGARFYGERNGVAPRDSAVANRLRAQGAVIVGKTNLHQLAYGITGENPDYGDCLQPRDPQRLTGGSSSGAAASVQEDSAFAAIGTDTGGSIRVPAALCGLAGYRASLDVAHAQALWQGSVHLAESFDTLGWIFRDLRDAPVLAEALFGMQAPEWAGQLVRIACVSTEFIRDCENSVRDVFARWQVRLRDAGAEIVSFDSQFWEEAMNIFAPIQANEAAAIHAAATGGDFSHFESSIAERLQWGATIDAAEMETLRRRHAQFRERMDLLWSEYDFLIAPCAPVTRLVAGVDNTGSRRQILRYTTPLSLCGSPVVTLPDPSGAAVQLAAARGEDTRLLAFAARLGAR